MEDDGAFDAGLRALNESGAALITVLDDQSFRRTRLSSANVPEVDIGSLPHPGDPGLDLARGQV